MADKRNRTPFYGAVPTSKIQADHVFMADGDSVEDVLNILIPSTEITMYGGQTQVIDGQLESARVNKITIGDIEKRIPTSVTRLTGYGWSAGTAYNSIEWVDDKVYFHRRVNSVDLGTLEWGYNSTYNVFYVEPFDLRKPGYSNLICPLYTTVAKHYSLLNDKEISGSATTGGFNVKNTDYTNADDFKTAMDGILLYYELAEEVITDITNKFPTNFNYFAEYDEPVFGYINTDVTWTIPYTTNKTPKIYAERIVYDNTNSGLSATNVQAAIDEIAARLT